MEKEYVANAYSVGDKVVISESVRDDTVIQDLLDCIGQEATIVGYVGDGGYMIDIDGGDWAWYDCDFEPIEKPAEDNIHDVNLLDFLEVI